MTAKTSKRKQRATQQEVEQERAEERAIFERYQKNPSPESEEQIIEKFTPLVHRIVNRFRFSPDQREDLVQEGKKGLLLAIRRFDLSRNYRFSTYAWQTIQGEIQRYFRDRTWALNVPRDLKERSLKVFNSREELVRTMGQEPTVEELAMHAGISQESVLEALELGSAYHPQSFQDYLRETDVVPTLSGEGAQLDSSLGNLEGTKRGLLWKKLLSHLDENEALVLKLYFFEQRTQKEISDKLATSQMNVSRIMRKGLGKLRRILVVEDADTMGLI
jgi:RNA polymerase sigma-B factor